jgi:ABC-type multidrug transport system fused ATPase/permease subunit
MTRLRKRIRDLILPPADAEGIVAHAPRVPVREMLRRFWPLARPYRGMIALGLLAAAIVPAIETAEIWIFKLVIDDVLVPRELEPLVWLALAYVGLALVGAVIGFADEYLAAWVGERFLLDLRTRVFAHLQGLSHHALDRRRRGDLLSRLTGDVQAIEAFVLAGIGDGLSAVLRILFFGGALFVLDWRLALVSLVVAPMFYLTARHFSRLSKEAAREKRRRTGSLSAVAEQSLDNAALVQSLNRQRDEVARFRREGERAMQAELGATRVRGAFTPIVDLIELTGALTVIALGTWALSRGDLTLGGMLVFLAYLSQLYGPVRDLGRLTQTMFAAAAGAERVVELLDERPSVFDAPGALPLRRAHGMVELQEVSYRYPGAVRDALAGVSLEVRPGETVAMVGASGAGKSTLARLLMRFDDPTAGTVLLDGHDLRELTVESVRDHVGLLLQDAPALHASVRENIAYGREQATEAEVIEAAHAAGAHEFIVGLPDGYETLVGERGRKLSGGQRQRLAVARALVRDSPILILDEPTTGLDAAAKAALLEPLAVLARGRTTILISHDPDVVRWADRTIVLDRGRIVRDGGPALTPTEVVA